MPTLQEILDLLPDNDTGAIDAADVRAAVTALWERTNGTAPIESIQFDTSLPDPGFMPGNLHWNEDDQTLNVDSEFTGVTLQLGQEQWARVRNTSGSTIANGRPVRITGATGQVPTIALDNGQGLISAVATHDIPNNSFGMVTTFGLVRDFDTSALTDGAFVYSSATGTLTTAVTGSAVGVVLLAHPTQGVLFTRPRSLDQADGTTANRPAARPTGFMYYDTTLGIPIWWNGSSWRNASNGVV